MSSYFDPGTVSTNTLSEYQRRRKAQQGALAAQRTGEAKTYRPPPSSPAPSPTAAFDPGTTETPEARARRLHQQAIASMTPEQRAIAGGGLTAPVVAAGGTEATVPFLAQKRQQLADAVSGTAPGVGGLIGAAQRYLGRLGAQQGAPDARVLGAKVIGQGVANLAGAIGETTLTGPGSPTVGQVLEGSKKPAGPVPSMMQLLG
ncbi:MAG: hypothetical protein ACREJS_15320, partial [Candidatus Rokuibacteriota bacterium]